MQRDNWSLSLLITGFLIYSISMPAMSNQADLSWTNATENEDGSAIPETGDGALEKTLIKYSLCLDGDVDPDNQTVVEVTPDITELSVTNLAEGQHCFRATHVNNLGNESDVSNLAVKTVVNAPLPPTSLQVGSKLTVYNIIKQPDKIILIPVGTVPSGTACLPEYVVSGYHNETLIHGYIVPASSVEWAAPSFQFITVYAECVEL